MFPTTEEPAASTADQPPSAPPPVPPAPGSFPDAVQAVAAPGGPLVPTTPPANDNNAAPAPELPGERDSGELALIFLDLESSGLREQEDVILEVACIAVDPVTLRERGRFHRLVIQPLPAGVDPFVLVMHSKNKLWEELEGESKIRKVTRPELDKELEAWLREQGAMGRAKVSLAGNSVHYDLRLVQRQCPDAARVLSHRVYDVSTLLIEARSRGVDLRVEGYDHRAMADIECSLKLARLFREVTGNLTARKVA